MHRESISAKNFIELKLRMFIAQRIFPVYGIFGFNAYLYSIKFTVRHIVTCCHIYSKKPVETRQSELHDAISPSLVEVTAASVSDWIRDKQLSQFLLAVVQHCSNDVTAILENVVSLLEQPFDEEVS